LIPALQGPFADSKISVNFRKILLESGGFLEIFSYLCRKFKTPNEMNNSKLFQDILNEVRNNPTPGMNVNINMGGENHYNQHCGHVEVTIRTDEMREADRMRKELREALTAEQWAVLEAQRSRFHINHDVEYLKFMCMLHGCRSTDDVTHCIASLALPPFYMNENDVAAGPFIAQLMVGAGLDIDVMKPDTVRRKIPAAVSRLQDVRRAQEKDLKK
jgi:hypothetical protein